MFTLQEDNEPKHAVQALIEWFKLMHIKLFQTKSNLNVVWLQLRICDWVEKFFDIISI